MTEFTVIIPARYASTRFPGKPLARIGAKPMLEHVYERAIEAGAAKVIVATDDKRIQDAALAFGADICMTSDDHVSGTTRIAEVIAARSIADNDIVINVQGDEPFIPPDNIRQVADNLQNHASFPMATLCYPIDNDEDVFNPNVVKVVKSLNGKAIYFSRSPIPFAREVMQIDAKGRLSKSNEALRDGIHIAPKQISYFRHIGIYAYRAEFVRQFSQMQNSMLEQSESLEQLRVLENGYEIHIDLACKAPPHGVDTPADLKRLNAL